MFYTVDDVESSGRPGRGCRRESVIHGAVCGSGMTGVPSPWTTPETGL